MNDFISGVDGAVTIATSIPGQFLRAAEQPPIRQLAVNYLKNSMSGIEPSEYKALPYIVLGMVGLIAYNIWKGSK